LAFSSQIDNIVCNVPPSKLLTRSAQLCLCNPTVISNNKSPATPIMPNVTHHLLTEISRICHDFETCTKTIYKNVHKTYTAVEY